MEIEFDIAKETANIAKHDVSLTLAARLFKGHYKDGTDERKAYGEPGLSQLVILTVVFTCVFLRCGARSIGSFRYARQIGER